VKYVFGALAVFFVAMAGCGGDDDGQPPCACATGDGGNGGVDAGGGGNDAGPIGTADASADAGTDGGTDGGALAQHVGGTVVGLAAGSVVLQNNGGDDLTITKNGTFAFATSVARNATYDVQVKTQPAGDFCSVVNGNGTIGTTDVSNVVVVCGDELPCPIGSSSTKQTVCGRLSDLKDNSLFLTNTNCAPCAAATATGPCSLKITAYDAIAYAADPTSAAPLAAAESFVDTCGRYRLKDVTVPASPIMMLVFDDASGAAAGPTGTTVPVAVAIQKAAATATRDVEAWIATQATTQGWETSGGPALSSGVFMPIFRAHVAKPGADLFANQSGVTVTKSSLVNASNDHYFAAGATSRTTLDPAATATGANGTAIYAGASVADGPVYSGQGGLSDPTNCVWETKVGASMPSVVFVQIFRPTNALSGTCAL
jgi:hypothetical protein